MMYKRKKLTVVSFFAAGLLLISFQKCFNPAPEAAVSVNLSSRRAHSSPVIYRITDLQTAEDVPKGVFKQSPTGAEFAYVVQYDPENKSLVVENIKLKDSHPFGFIFNADSPTRAPPSGTLFISDLHGTTIGPLGIIRSTPENIQKVIAVGDMLDRGPSVENALELVNELVLGDHDVWAIGAAMGNEHLLTLWLRMCYRNPPNEELLKKLNINLSEFEKFAKEKYVPLLAKAIAEEKNEDVNSWIQKSPEDLIKEAKALGIIRKRGPKSIYEMAALNLHLKVTLQIKEEIQQIESGAEQGDKEAQNQLKKLKMVLLPGPNDSLAELTGEEKRILENLKGQFLKSKKVHEFIKMLLDKAEIYKIVNFGDKKVLVLHGIVPMDENGNLVGLPSYPGLTGMALLEKMQERLKDLKSAYQEFTKNGDESNLKSFRDEFSYWGDNVNSPLFPTEQTRLYHSYIDDRKEPSNPAYRFLSTPQNAQNLLNQLGVDIIILGHKSQKEGRVKDLSGIGKILIIDGTFSKKGGEVGATETGAGFYISQDSKNVYALHLLTMKELLKSRSGEIRKILLENLRLADIAYYDLKDLKLKDLLEMKKQYGLKLPFLEDLKKLCNEKGGKYDQIIQNSEYLNKSILDITKELLGLAPNTDSKEIYKKLGSPYPTRFVFPAGIRPRNLLLPSLGVELTHLDYSNLAEVAVLKINSQKGIRPVIAIDKNFNGRLYANREKRVVEFKSNGLVKNIPINKMNEIRDEMPTIDEFINEYESAYPDKRVVISIPASNILWNDWFVAYSNGELSHRLGEPIQNRKYSVFLVRNDGSISIQNIKFKEQDGGIKIINAQTGEVIEDIGYFTFGQQILRDGKVVKITQISNQFDDLRHLIAFPEIRTPNKDLDYGGSLFFGQSELLENRALVNKALEGEVMVIPDTSIRDNIELYDFETRQKLSQRRIVLNPGEIEKLLKGAGYKKVDSQKDVQESGQFYYDAKRGKVYIKFKRALFSHTAIGLTKDGEIIAVSTGALKKGGGVKVEDVAEILKRYGAVNGLLLCNGLDVALKLYDQRIFSAEERMWGQRGKFSSVILFVKDRK